MWIFSPRSARSSKRSRSARPRGFTLIELMVVVSIMIIITIVVLVRQSRFDSSTLLRSLAYSVALSVRQAQIFGSSVLGTTTTSANCIGGNYSTVGTCYASAYGIHYAAGSSSYTLFADLNNNGQFDANEAVKTFSFNNGYGLKDFCATQISNGTQWCASASLITWLDVVFRRPNPEACFASDGGQAGACAAGATPFYSQAKLTLVNQSDPTNTRSVTITQTGAIQVCALTGC